MEKIADIPVKISDDAPIKVVSISETPQNTITTPVPVPIVRPQRVVEISEDALFADKLFKDNPNTFQMVDDYMMNTHKLSDEITQDFGRKPGTTWGEILVDSIKETDVKIKGNIFHGTSPQARESILKNGFDLRYATTCESGKGFYFGFDEKAIDSYVQGGGAMIKAKLAPGVKIGKLGQGHTTLPNYIKRDGEVQNGLRKIFGLRHENIGSKIDNILNEYITRKFSSMGYGGLITGSKVAGCNYLCIFDPKNIQVLS